MLGMFEFYKMKLFNKKKMHQQFNGNFNKNGRYFFTGLDPKASQSTDNLSEQLNSNSASRYSNSLLGGVGAIAGLDVNSPSTNASKYEHHLTSASSARNKSDSLKRNYSFEKKQFTLLNSLKNEDQLLNQLVEYFLAMEEYEKFSCIDEHKSTYPMNNARPQTLNKIRNISTNTNTPLDAGTLSTGRMRKSISTLSLRSAQNLCSKRCYFTSIQVHVAQAFKTMDIDFDNKLSFKEFSIGIKNILNDNYHIQNENATVESGSSSIINDETILKKLFVKFDLNQDEYVDFAEFIKSIPIPMCHKRVKVLNEAFDKLDANKDNLLDSEDFEAWFRKNHAYFQNCSNNDVKLQKAVVSCMSNFNMCENELKAITRSKFIEYYQVISSTIMNDAYFDLLIRNTHHL